MPLRQIARTPSRPFPLRDGLAVPYAFAVEILRDDRPYALDIVIVRCPWCGGEERAVEGVANTCPGFNRRYTVAIPAGTPVLA